MHLDLLTLALILAALLLLGPCLLAWIKIGEWLKGKSFDSTRFVTHEQLASLRSDRDAQIKTTFELLTNKIDHLTETIDRLDQDLRQVRGDMPSLHHAIGSLEGKDRAESSKRPR